MKTYQSSFNKMSRFGRFADNYVDFFVKYYFEIFGASTIMGANVGGIYAIRTNDPNKFIGGLAMGCGIGLASPLIPLFAVGPLTYKTGEIIFKKKDKVDS
jgi:hypothetical protein